jgi:hypothetical protein
LATHASRSSLAAAFATYAGKVTPEDFAHASFSLLVKQQQLFQHCSADWHPQGRFWQGNGVDVSLEPAGCGIDMGTNDSANANSVARLTSLRVKVRCRILGRRIMFNISTGEPVLPNEFKGKLALHTIRLSANREEIQAPRGPETSGKPLSRGQETHIPDT